MTTVKMTVNVLSKSEAACESTVSLLRYYVSKTSSTRLSIVTGFVQVIEVARRVAGRTHKETGLVAILISERKRQRLIKLPRIARRPYAGGELRFVSPMRNAMRPMIVTGISH